jgi:hypothetical protein
VCRSVEKAGLRVEALTSVLHAPRVLVVALAGWIDRLGNERLRRGLARVVLAFEHLEVLPTRYLTGHYVLIRAVKPHAE